MTNLKTLVVALVVLTTVIFGLPQPLMAGPGVRRSPVVRQPRIDARLTTDTLTMVRPQYTVRPTECWNSQAMKLDPVHGVARVAAEAERSGVAYLTCSALHVESGTRFKSLNLYGWISPECNGNPDGAQIRAFFTCQPIASSHNPPPSSGPWVRPATLHTEVLLNAGAPERTVESSAGSTNYRMASTSMDYLFNGGEEFCFIEVEGYFDDASTSCKSRGMIVDHVSIGLEKPESP
ncbi:MAG: hypothetical protein HYW02_00140 [Deltaproteobacteria bacterium]|nr:hypothetical protein [Deltaproteobacteria bacterium]